MAGSRDRSSVARRVLVGALLLAVVVGSGALLGRSLSDTDRSSTGAAAPGPGSTSAPRPPRLSPANYAAAPVVVLPRLRAAATKGHLALPWRRLAVRREHLEIVFASRPSCEQVNGVVVQQTRSSVTINVLATRIVNAPNCDLVPEAKRTAVTLAAPLAARSLRHARLDATYWPTNPFDEA
jgi:hypothetical protein